VVEIDEQDARSGQRAAKRPGQRPAGPPPLAGNGNGPDRHWFDRNRLPRRSHDRNRLHWHNLDRFRQRQRDNLTALVAHSEVVEHLLSLVRGEGLLKEGADLVRVWVVPGLEMLAHAVSGGGVDAVC
jgi:hypothetical protein